MMARLYAEVLGKAVRGMSPLELDATCISWQVHDDWGDSPFVDAFIKALAENLRHDSRVSEDERMLAPLMKNLLPDWHSRIDAAFANSQ